MFLSILIDAVVVYVLRDECVCVRCVVLCPRRLCDLM